MNNKYILKINDTTKQIETFYMFPFAHLRDAAYDIIESVLHDTRKEAEYVIENYISNGTYPFLTKNDVTNILNQNWESILDNITKVNTLQEAYDMLPKNTPTDIETITIP